MHSTLLSPASSCTRELSWTGTVTHSACWCRCCGSDAKCVHGTVLDCDYSSTISQEDPDSRSPVNMNNHGDATRKIHSQTSPTDSLVALGLGVRLKLVVIDEAWYTKSTGEWGVPVCTCTRAPGADQVKSTTYLVYVCDSPVILPDGHHGICRPRLQHKSQNARCAVHARPCPRVQ